MQKDACVGIMASQKQLYGQERILGNLQDSQFKSISLCL